MSQGRENFSFQPPTKAYDNYSCCELWIFYFFGTSVKALSLLCVANRMANQPIYPGEFVLKFTLLGYLAAVCVILWMIGSNALKPWFALACRTTLIWSAKCLFLGDDDIGARILWLMTNPACHLYAEFSTSCIEKQGWVGKKCHQRSPRNIPLWQWQRRWY